MLDKIKHFTKDNKLLIAIFFFVIGTTIYLYPKNQTNNYTENTIKTGTQEALSYNTFLKAPKEGEEIEESISYSTTSSELQFTRQKNTSGKEKTSESLPVDGSATIIDKTTNTEKINDTEEGITVTFEIPKIKFLKTLQVADGSNVYDAMIKLQNFYSFKFDGNSYGNLGFFVHTIENIKNDSRNGKFWIYYLNGKKAQVGISQQIINSDDIISWQYENEE